MDISIILKWKISFFVQALGKNLDVWYFFQIILLHNLHDACIFIFGKKNPQKRSKREVISGLVFFLKEGKKSERISFIYFNSPIQYSYQGIKLVTYSFMSYFITLWWVQTNKVQL